MASRKWAAQAAVVVGKTLGPAKGRTLVKKLRAIKADRTTGQLLDVLDGALSGKNKKRSVARKKKAA